MPDIIPPLSRSPVTPLEWALSYVDRGWSVVPVRRGEKMPAIPWARHQSAPANDALIHAWFDNDPTLGVGLVQGRHVGTIVLDFDGDLGLATLAQLEAKGLPISARQFTPRGGVHVLVNHPGQHVPTRKNVLPGMDVRGDGGFIVCCPSLGANQRPYAWDVDAHPDEAPIADCPDWLIPVICGPVVGGEDSSGQVIHAAIPAGPFNLPREVVADGRETYMRDTLLAVMRDMRDRLGHLPTPEDLIAAAWPQYEAKVDLTRPGRGHTEFSAKARYTLARAAAGLITGFKTQPDFDPETGEIPTETFGEKPAKAEASTRNSRALRFVSIAELEAMPLPEWLIHGVVPSEGLVVPYGPPKAGKTFIVLSMALHIAAGRDWFGRKVKQGAVVYIIGEGLGGFSMRLKAMRQRYDLPQDLPFYAVPRAVNFRDETDMDALEALIREHIPPGVRIALVVVDTLARAMVGVEENSAKEVGEVIAKCEAIGQFLACTVMPVAHTGKDVERGIRGTNAITGAVEASFLIQAAGPEHVRMTNDNQKDDGKGAPLLFRMEQINLGLRTSLVPVLEESRRPGRPRDPDAPSDEEMLMRVVVAMGTARELPFARVVEILGLSRGRAAGGLTDLIPVGREHAVRVQRGQHHSLLWRRIAGEHKTAPIFIHMEASDDGE